MVGGKLGPFSIVERIGAGGMGEVYRARDDRLGREVAIKVLPDSLAADRDRRDRFLREARAVASLNHRYVCTLHDIGEEGGRLYLVMELVDGQSLAERLAGGPIAVADALRLAAQIAEALSAAHSCGIVHRDLKPSNIHVTSEGSVKLLDFGLAKVDPRRSQPVEGSLTPTEMATGVDAVLGTAGYMAPEQARGRPVDERADAWALGVVLFEMIGGRRLFDGGTAADVLAAVLLAPIPFDVLPTDLPGAVRELLEHLIERDRDRRLGDLEQARQALSAAAAAVGAVSATPLVGPSAAATVEPVRRPEERSLLVLPFANLSPEPAQDYFPDGLTEEVISDLSRVSSLRVISRTSAMRLKGSTHSLSSLAQELGVGYVLEGSVRRAGDSFRITAQLVDAGSDSLLWSEKYGGTVDDVFAVQERVSRAIVGALELRLTRAEDAALAARPIADPRAWDVFLRARHEINLFTAGGLVRAGNLLNRALEMVGPNPLVHRGLGMLCWQYVNSGLDADPIWLRRAEEHAGQCLRLDPDGPHGPSVLGLVCQARGDLHGWVRHLSRAAEIDPGDSDILVWLGHAWNCAGRPEQARPLFERLVARDPLFDFVHFGLGNLARFAGDPRTAEGHYRRAGELTPDNPGWTMVLADAIAAQGDRARAVALVESAAAPPDSHPLAAVSHLEAAAWRGDASTVETLLTPELRAALWHDVQYPRFVAAAWAAVGRADEALEWLQRCADNGFICHPFYAREELFSGLRHDPRFTAFLHRIEERWRRFPSEVALSGRAARLGRPTS